MTQNPRILAFFDSRSLYGQERANILVLDTLKAQGCDVLAVVEYHSPFRAMPQELENHVMAYVKGATVERRVDCYLFDFLIGNPILYHCTHKYHGTHKQLCA